MLQEVLQQVNGSFASGTPLAVNKTSSSAETKKALQKAGVREKIGLLTEAP